MNDSHTTRNYFAHGGEELVIGGKLTFLPGATVEGGEGLFDLPTGDSASAVLPALPDSKATSTAQLREDLNRLLAALRSAGLMAADESTEGAEGSGDAE